MSVGSTGLSSNQQHVGAVSEQHEHCGMTTAVDRHEASHVRGLHARKCLRQRVQPRGNLCDGVLVGEPFAFANSSANTQVSNKQLIEVGIVG